jgi:hypothetical protein
MHTSGKWGERERENVNEPTRTHLGRRGGGDPDDGRFNSSFVLNDSYRSWLKQKGSNRPYFSLLYTWLCVCVHRGCCCSSIGFSLPKLLRQFHKPTLGDPGRGFLFPTLSCSSIPSTTTLRDTHTHTAVWRFNQLESMTLLAVHLNIKKGGGKGPHTHEMRDRTFFGG